MTYITFPQLHGLAWSLKRSIAFRNAVQPSVANGYETRLNLGGPDPLFNFELQYTVLFAGAGPDGQGHDELSQLEAFFLARKGSFDSFLIDAGAVTKNPAESFVVDQTLVMDVNGNAPLVRTKPGNSFQPYDEAIYELALDESMTFVQPVIKLDDTPLVAGTDYNLLQPSYVAGGALNANGITYAGYVVQFLGSPVPTGRVSADFSWAYRVRFAQDLQEFDMFHYLLWECQQLQLVGCRN